MAEPLPALPPELEAELQAAVRGAIDYYTSAAKSGMPVSIRQSMYDAIRPILQRQHAESMLLRAEIARLEGDVRIARERCDEARREVDRLKSENLTLREQRSELIAGTEQIIGHAATYLKTKSIEDGLAYIHMNAGLWLDGMKQKAKLPADGSVRVD